VAELRNAGFGADGRDPGVEINKPGPRPFWREPRNLLWIYVLLMVGSLWLWRGAQQVAREQIPYSEFLQNLDQGVVKEAVLADDVIRGTLTLPGPNAGTQAIPGAKSDAQRRFVTVRTDDDALAQLLAKHGVKFSVVHQSHWLSGFLFNWVLPFGLLFLVWGWLGKRMGNRGFLNLGANRARIHAETGPRVTFEDVAGAEEAKEELKEVIDFLKDPARIQSLGGRMPKGVLLAGAPGTGKTLLARAVSGEAQVPFFSIGGSEFIELFVGMGAARVRELFEQARQKAPCIIFIDELDAIGGARGIGPAMGGHDEREQTLNQLLSEMDGFDPSVGVVVMAATNRPEVLDKALLRSGRFDRQIVVDRPDLEAREAILRLHTARMKLAGDVDLRVVAQRTPGFVGADLANIANEAAIRAVRHAHRAVTMADFEEAIDRVIAGPERKRGILNAGEKRRVAFHESGHTLVALTVPTGEPVHKVSIIPRGVAALGYTLQLPEVERLLPTKSELKDQLAILLGGRVAEELVFGDVSAGAHNDLERASEIARSMVTQLGMNDKLGPLTYGRRRQLAFLGVTGEEERNYSEATARLIDVEVRSLVDEAHQRARDVLSARRPLLETLAVALQEREVIGREEVERLVRAYAAPSSPPDQHGTPPRPLKSGSSATA
jgi:cell division protease FtsH